MRLITFNDGQEKIGALVSDGELADLSYDDRIAGMDMMTALEDWDNFLPLARSVLNGALKKAVADVRLMAPVPRPRKLLAIGLNYLDHIQEAIDHGIKIPEVPMMFTKAVTSVNGPYDDVHLPKVSEALDYEAEFGIVISKRCRHVKKEDAVNVIAGFVALNDVSVRDWQMAAGQFSIGKSFDTHCPMGPALLTIDETGAEPALAIKGYLNDEEVQSDNTAKLKFSVPDLIEHLSKAMTLEPGDVIATGTPGGVGGAKKPPVYMKEGDVFKVEVESIGSLINTIVDEPDGYLSEVTSIPG